MSFWWRKFEKLGIGTRGVVGLKDFLRTMIFEEITFGNVHNYLGKIVAVLKICDFVFVGVLTNN